MISWKSLSYTDRCRKLIEHQQPRKKFHQYMPTFDEWIKIIGPHLKNLTSDSTILSIGCGLGTDSLIIHKELNCNVVLIDKSVDLDNPPRLVWSNHAVKMGGDISYGYSCNLDVTKENFILNGCPKNKLSVYECDDINWTEIPKLDLVLSKSSWGMHYHLNEYWDHVDNKLKPDGSMLLTFYSSASRPGEMSADSYKPWLSKRGWDSRFIANTKTSNVLVHKLVRK